jgi:hypothetical protein
MIKNIESFINKQILIKWNKILLNFTNLMPVNFNHLQQYYVANLKNLLILQAYIYPKLCFLIFSINH